MPYAKVNPTGCAERHGLIQARLDMFLESGDVRFDDTRFYVIDETSKEYLAGYTGKVDEFGSPIDLEAYAVCEASLPRVWLAERCFHHHFIYLDPYTLRDEHITDAIAHHLPNFYKAWTEEWDKVQGGMRHGWDVACRRPRPTRYNLKAELYDTRKLDCLSAVDILKTSEFATQVIETGETFPSTDIDVGSAAINRFSQSILATTATVNTYVEGDNPANAGGTIDTVEAYFYSVAAGNQFRVGTFSDGGSNSLTCRDSEVIGEVSNIGKQTYSGLDITISSGDYIGADSNNVKKALRLDCDTSGGTGTWSVSGSVCSASTTTTFSWSSGGILSLYGTGDTGPHEYSADALRILHKQLTYPADAARVIHAGQAYPSDARRLLHVAQAHAADALRRIAIQDAHSADTLRVVVLTLNDIYAADVLRQLQQRQSSSGDTARILAQAHHYEADALRILAALEEYVADSYRLLRADSLYSADALRVLRALHVYTGDTDRWLRLDLSDRYAADTRRVAFVVIPYLTGAYRLEIRNQSGQLLAIPRLLSGTLTRSLNAPDALSAMIAADDPAREHITPANLLYVRDDSGAVVSVCIPAIEEREHR